MSSDGSQDRSPLSGGRGGWGRRGRQDSRSRGMYFGNVFESTQCQGWVLGGKDQVGKKMRRWSMKGRRKKTLFPSKKVLVLPWIQWERSHGMEESFRNPDGSPLNSLSKYVLSHSTKCWRRDEEEETRFFFQRMEEFQGLGISSSAVSLFRTSHPQNLIPLLTLLSRYMQAF